MEIRKNVLTLAIQDLSQPQKFKKTMKGFVLFFFFCYNVNL